MGSEPRDSTAVLLLSLANPYREPQAPSIKGVGSRLQKFSPGLVRSLREKHCALSGPAHSGLSLPWLG